MAGIRVQTKVIYNHLPEIKTQYEEQAHTVLGETAALIERDAKQSMRGPKHGRTYRRKAITKSYKVGGKKLKEFAGRKAVFSGGRASVVVGYTYHRASKRGEAPAIDLGKLVNSIDTAFQGKLTALVYSTAIYARRLELEMDRAFLRPAAEKQWPGFLAKMKRILGE